MVSFQTVTKLLPASAEEKKRRSNNDILKSSIHPIETDSDSSKPRIRVRRLSGDKLSGISPSTINFFISYLVLLKPFKFIFLPRYLQFPSQKMSVVGVLPPTMLFQDWNRRKALNNSVVPSQVR